MVAGGIRTGRLLALLGAGGTRRSLPDRLARPAGQPASSPSLGNFSATVTAHPDELILPTVAAHAAVQIRGVGAVLQVISAARRQSGLQLLGPFLIGPGEPKHPVRGQVQVAEHPPERLARIDRIQELLPYFDGQSLLRSGSSPGSLSVAVGPPAQGCSDIRHASGPACRAQTHSRRER